MIEDEHAIGYDIQGLEPGNCYFIRVRAGNEHGFGCPATSTPPGATPSSKYHSLMRRLLVCSLPYVVLILRRGKVSQAGYCVLVIFSYFLVFDFMWYWYTTLATHHVLNAR